MTVWESTSRAKEAGDVPDKLSVIRLIKKPAWIEDLATNEYKKTEENSQCSLQPTTVVLQSIHCCIQSDNKQSVT
ncbi:MAG: hypothetical protein NPIRA05_01150 [Nitrospirales bacterium]|nr:MAG: hypothetical protein NPIRA05_01150 [Nitrospirales bacterium]